MSTDGDKVFLHFQELANLSFLLTNPSNSSQKIKIIFASFINFLPKNLTFHHLGPSSPFWPIFTKSTQKNCWVIFEKNKHVWLLNNGYLTSKLDLAPFQCLFIDKNWFISLRRPCGQDSVGSFRDGHEFVTNSFRFDPWPFLTLS